ncbi:MAG: diguanylate cyclase [Betaproteobacteria bacterium]|nr:diguanylate cyclase [Betaproteobacteria bacterium]
MAHDLSYQPQAEALDESDTGFRTLAESTHLGIALHRGGRIIYANQAAGDMTGFSVAELCAMEFWEMAVPAEREAIRERGRRRSERKNKAASTRFQRQLNTKDGRECWVDVTACVIDFQKQETVLVTYVDITELKRAEKAQYQFREIQTQVIEGSPVPTFVINAQHEVTHWNHACEAVTGILAGEMVGRSEAWRAFHSEERPIMADLVLSGAPEQAVEAHYRGKSRRSPVIEGAYEAEDFFPHFGEAGRWLVFTAALLRDPHGNITGAIETLQDVTERKMAESALLTAQVDLEQLVEKRTAQLARANEQLEADVERRQRTESELLRRNSELTELNRRLGEAQAQLLQSEKMASVGQLAAGVAHEINNPIGYVHSNLGSLEKYLADLFKVLAGYEAAEPAISGSPVHAAALKELKDGLDLEFLKEDIPVLMRESKEGISRVRKIVQDLKDFSRVDSQQQWEWSNLHRGIDSTLNIVANEIKYCAEVVKDYGDIPDVECLQSQVNQVFMNLLVNAAHAIEGARGTITISTRMDGDDLVRIEVTDTGKGIPPENLQRIFDPFFTTKPIGKGTGLGLSLSYGIVQKHGGRLQVRSVVGKGTTFSVSLPVHKSVSAGPAEKEMQT